MPGSRVEDLSRAFAIRIVKLNKYLKEEKRDFVLSNQILRSGTSIGANISEAKYAESRLDFVHKMRISLKETNETLYWLRLMLEGNYISQPQFESLEKECKSILYMLIKIINTTSNNL